MSELLVMAGETAHTTGVEAGARDCLTEKNRNSLISLFQEKAAQWNSVLLITGKEDMVVSADQCAFVRNGCETMSQITGTGCMLGMICATYLAGSDPFSAAVWAAVEFGLAGEKAAKKSKGPGSFQTELLDCFFLLTEKEIQEEKKLF